MDNRDLDRHLIGYREETVRIEIIDLMTGGRYGLQNREESEVPEDVMEDYTAAWLRNDPFPPIILWKDGSKYFPVDGYTRCASALRAGKEEIHALVIDCEESVARRLCIEANARHGRRASREFLIRGAVGLVEEGMSVREAAARTSLPEAVVAERRAVAKAQNRARQNHVTGVDRVPDSVLEKIANIEMDSSFKELLELRPRCQAQADQGRGNRQGGAAGPVRERSAGDHPRRTRRTGRHRR